MSIYCSRLSKICELHETMFQLRTLLSTWCLSSGSIADSCVFKNNQWHQHLLCDKDEKLFCAKLSGILAYRTFFFQGHVRSNIPSIKRI